MAEYRHASYPAADAALAGAEHGANQTGSGRPLIEGTSRLYLAMSLFRQGKEAEARQLFATAEAQMKPLPAEGQPLKEIADHDDFILWLAYKEARALIFRNSSR